MKLYNNVELLDFDRRYSHLKKTFVDTVSVRYNDWDEVFIIHVHYKNKNDITIDITHLRNNWKSTAVTGSLQDIIQFYKETAKRANEDSINEIEAALVGFYIYKLFKILDLNKKTEDIWKSIINK